MSQSSVYEQLMQAVEQDDVEVVKKLLGQGLDPHTQVNWEDQRDYKRSTSLVLWVAGKGELNLLKLLLENG